MANPNSFRFTCPYTEAQVTMSGTAPQEGGYRLFYADIACTQLPAICVYVPLSPAPATEPEIIAAVTASREYRVAVSEAVSTAVQAAEAKLTNLRAMQDRLTESAPAALMTVSQFAAACGVGPRYVRNEIARGGVIAKAVPGAGRAVSSYLIDPSHPTNAAFRARAGRRAKKV